MTWQRLGALHQNQQQGVVLLQHVLAVEQEVAQVVVAV
jgi:uracil DNA glycosylase